MKRELTIRVTLIPELTHPDGPRAPLLFVPPARFERKGRTLITLMQTYTVD